MDAQVAEKVVEKGLATGELLTKFFEDCRTRGLTSSTIKGYNAYLKHFAAENPELPTDPQIIEKWLLPRGESFQKRGNVLKRLQSFYDYLWRIDVVSASPIPAGKMGRPSKPPKPKRPRGRPRKAINVDKVVEGGVQTFTVTFSGTITIRPSSV